MTRNLWRLLLWPPSLLVDNQALILAAHVSVTWLRFSVQKFLWFLRRTRKMGVDLLFCRRKLRRKYVLTFLRDWKLRNKLMRRPLSLEKSLSCSNVAKHRHSWNASFLPLYFYIRVFATHNDRVQVLQKVFEQIDFRSTLLRSGLRYRHYRLCDACLSTQTSILTTI